MKPVTRRAALSVLLPLALAALLPLHAGAAPALRDVATARAKVYPALVNITVVMRYFAGGRAQRTAGGGSGVIVTPQGDVVTNFHVAGNTTRITCTLTTGETLEATVVAHDLPTDLSVLKLRTEKRAHPKEPLPYARLGDSDALQIGEPVVAMGNPLMLSSSLTLGVVSNKNRVFTDFLGTEMEDQELDEDQKTGMFTRWIQHDALILPGNSGGPLVNMRGQVVGINELGGDGVGFAIPSNTVSRVLHQVLAYGSVRRGWIGVSVLPVSKLARKTGALVSGVAPNAPAAAAGLQPGDILLSIDGRPSDARFFEQVPDLYQRIADMQIGSQVGVRYLRAGRVRTAMVKVALMPPVLGREIEVRKLGITVRGITDSMMLSHRLATTAGVLVTGVRPGRSADASNLQISEEDVITSVGATPTPSLPAFRKAISSVTGDQTIIGFRRGPERMLTSVKLTPDESSDEGGELPKAWLGIKTQVVTGDLAAALGKPDLKGFRVTEVYPGTKARASGLQTGDVIVSLNGHALDASRQQDSEDLRRAIEELSVGETAKLGVMRGTSQQDLAVTLEGQPMDASRARKSRQEDLELTVREITPADRMDHPWWKDNQAGVLVTDATQGGWANMAGVHVDDVLISMQDHPIDSLDRFDALMKQTMRQKPHVIELFVLRGTHTHFVFIEPDWAHLGLDSVSER